MACVAGYDRALMLPAPSAALPAAPPRAAGVTDRQARVAVAGMMLTMLLGTMDQTIVATAMPRVVASLDGFDRYPWATTAYLLTSTIFVPIFGKLADLYGRKPLYLWGIVLFVAASWLCGAAGLLPLPGDGMTQLIAARAAQGIGAGAVTAITFTIVADLFAPAERGRYQGLFAAVVGAGAIAGPAVGGYIADHLSWRWAFYVNAPLGLVAVLMLRVALPPLPPRATHKILDWAGLLTLVGWTLPFMLALGRLASGTAPAGTAALLATAAVMFTAFVAIEVRAIEPLVPPSLFRIPAIATALAIVFVAAVALMGVLVYLPLYMQAVRGWSAATSGSLFVPMMVALLLAGIASGHWLAKTGRYKPLAVGGSATAALGILLLAGMAPTASQATFLWLLPLCGLGFGAAAPVYQLVVQNAAPPSQLGAATASVQFFTSIGGILGAALFGAVLLGIYQADLRTALPPGAPASVLQLVDNPLHFAEAQPQLEQLLAGMPDGRAAAAAVVDAARDSLARSMQVLFTLTAILIAVSAGLNLLLPSARLQTRGPYREAQDGLRQ
jgi:EmrB/QacA subfamily drug resistance transporter